MKQKRQIILTLILGFSQLLASEVQEQKKFQGFGFKGIQNGKAVIEFENSNYELKSVEHMGTIYQKPEIALSGAMINEGDPYLPSITTFYAVEPGKSYSASVSVLASEAIDNIDILPFQGWDKDKHDADLPMIRNHVFESDAQFPSNIVHVSEPIVMRDLTLVKVTLTPFQYNPVSKVLTVIQNAEISLEVSGESESHFQPAKRSRAFEPLYKSLVVNYEDFSRNAGDYQRPSILYVLPSNIGGLMSTVQLLMDWKHRLGYEVNYVSSSNVVNSSTNLKNYLEDAYETWDNPPEFVTLVGDVNGTYDIPTFFENFSSYNGEGDHPYSQLAGSDLFPEVMLGRLSFSSQSELNTIVGKNINYESAPYMGEDWYSRACLTGDPNTSGISCIITNENIEEILELHEYTDINTIYSGSFPSQMLSGLNAGVSFFNYRGWIGTSGFGSGDINNSSNGFMLPIATMITCATGSFSGSSIIESFLRAGTASVPKGAVASIGTATSGTHTMFNNLVDIGFYYGVFMDEIETAGAALMQAKLYLAKGYPSNPSDFVSIFTHWNNLMGDASLQMRTKFPTTLSVDFESWVTTGTNYVDIHVGSGSMSVQGAWVTILRDGDIFESGYTDPSGNLRLNIPSSISGEVLITVSKRNHYPYQSSFQIYDPGVSVNIVSNNITIDDDNMGQSSGNGNGIIESGETIELTIPLKNYGSTDASNINASIASEHSQISIISGSINYGDIASQESMAPASPFVVQVEAGMGESESFSLSLNIVAFEGDSWSAVVPFAVNGNQI
ncbi:MAG: hypothetical protein HN657_02760, partial [Candidatus Marinimicrobia bacterium]|nr:hypothetical protein [Candidatus Neomarinimicrobiota bacterium]MBT3496628.1 hypothetical protein [Candidatus Neomarinimicrobiota bacterium]MBT3692872.1 hypothetical protein [Candidatus Neomarinimicrobiota bacterium]MBT3732799.1 hypothetical protein [Candidatus Neomarinimicrobiota bacterium]MBT4143729.1 hypothetical protein [Candidatus Neomarinimicrobiota bacterium]